MPGDDVDDASVAPIGERDLRDDEPSAYFAKPCSHGLVEPGMPAVQHPIEVGTLPQDQSVEAGAERLRVASDIAEPDAIELPGFDQDCDAARDIGLDARVRLTKASS